MSICKARLRKKNPNALGVNVVKYRVTTAEIRLQLNTASNVRTVL